MLATPGRKPQLLLGGEQPLSPLWKHRFALFWQRFRHIEAGHPVYQDHGNRLHLCIPVSLYGDEGRGRSKTPCLVVTSSPLIGGGEHSLDTKLLYTTCFAPEYLKTRDRKNHTLLAIVEHLSQESAVLFSQGVPLPDPAGTNGVIKLYPVVVAIKGDWEWILKTCRLTRMYNANRVCWLCMAGVLCMLYANCDRGRFLQASI